MQVYPFSAKQIVSGIYACLEKFNTVIKVKSAEYKLKCYHKNMIKMTKYNSSMELFNDFSKVGFGLKVGRRRSGEQLKSSVPSIQGRQEAEVERK